jgi:hypothetical protein
VQAESDAVRDILRVEAGEDYMIEFSMHYAAPHSENRSLLSFENDFKSNLLSDQSLSASSAYVELPYDVYFDLKMNSVRVTYIQPFFNFLLWYYYDTEAIHKFVSSRFSATTNLVQLTSPSGSQRVQYQLNISNPFLLIPIHPTASHGVLLDLGHIKMKNRFFKKIDDRCLHPVVVLNAVQPPDPIYRSASVMKPPCNYTIVDTIPPAAPPEKTKYITMLNDVGDYHSHSIPNVQCVEEIFVSITDMNMKSYSREMFEDACAVAPSRRFASRSVKQVQSIADNIISDTMMSVIVQWPFDHSESAISSSMKSSSTTPQPPPPTSQPWSKYIIHVPQIVFNITEEQCEVLYRMVEFNICSQSNYYIGHNEALPALLRSEVNSNWVNAEKDEKKIKRMLIGSVRNQSDNLDPDYAEQQTRLSDDSVSKILEYGDIQDRKKEKSQDEDSLSETIESILNNSEDQLEEKKKERVKSEKVQKRTDMRWCTYAMVLQLDQLYFDFRHNASDAAKRKGLREQFEKKLEKMGEQESLDYTSNLTISCEERKKIIQKERENFEKLLPLDLKFVSVSFDARNILIEYRSYQDGSLTGDFILGTVTLQDISKTGNKFPEILTLKSQNGELNDVGSSRSLDQIYVTYRKPYEMARQTWVIDMHQIDAHLVSELFWSVLGFQLSFIRESLRFFYMWKEWRDPNYSSIVPPPSEDDESRYIVFFTIIKNN